MIINVLKLSILTKTPIPSSAVPAGEKNITADNPAPESKTQCTTEKSYINFNDMIMMHAITECKDQTDVSRYHKSNIYNVATKENLISVGLSSNSARGYEDNLYKFEQSINTLKVRDSIDHRTIWSKPLGLQSQPHSIEVKGKQIEIELESNSEISNLVFDDKHKKLSFNAQGANGTSGLAIVPVSVFLEGPYSITIDGEATQDFQVVEDMIAGETLLEIMYNHSVHQITITGTNVVPEFAVYLLGVLAAVMGIVAAIGRMKVS